MGIEDRLGLEGRTVVVAGAGGGGIGTAVSRLLAEAGAEVVGLDNRPEALAVLDEHLAGTPGRHRSVVVDVRRPDEVEQAVSDAAAQGRLHGLVHVVGGLWPHQWASLLDIELPVFDEVLELNLRAALVGMRTVARHLHQGGQGGAIVSVGSVAGLSAMPYGSPYAASKAALMALARTAALEWGAYGIRVNVVAPGTVATPKSAGGRPGGMATSTDAERAAVPLGRRGTPEEVAGAVVFLMSDLASWITGQVLAVDGGSSAKPSFLGGDNLPVFVQNPALRGRLLGEVD